MLGEALPPLRLLLQDSHGNAVPADAASWAERQVQLQVLQGSVAGGGAVLQELNVVADTVGGIQSIGRTADFAVCGGYLCGL
jgi:hypothetical protein